MKKIALVAATITLAGCLPPIAESKIIPMSSKQISQVHETVAYRLKDPNSAQFRNVRRVERVHTDGQVTTIVCGQVNAKNSFGGYVGFTSFNGYFNGNNFRVNGIGDNENSWIYELPCGGR